MPDLITQRSRSCTASLGHGARPRPSSPSGSLSDGNDDVEQTWTPNRPDGRTLKNFSFISATFVALCAGSIMVFSLYAPKFQSRLDYTQLQVNGIAIASSLGLYLPIPIMGYVCDRYGVAPLALLSSIVFGLGYGIAAAIYRRLDMEGNGAAKPRGHSSKWSYSLMILAFLCVGSGTCAMYISSVSTCAKNFGKGKYCGLALAIPVTAFGLSAMWISQFGSRYIYETQPGGFRDSVDVYRFFIFLAILLVVVGIIGTFTLRVVDEQGLIEEAIGELEQSGLLENRSLQNRSYDGYGTSNPVIAALNREATCSTDSSTTSGNRWKKSWVLNAKTRRFLTDRTMWSFALAFLLMIGPGEAFVNNLGSIIGTLSPPNNDLSSHSTLVATHVSIFGVTNTITRLIIGTATDLVAPIPETQHVQVGPKPRPLSSAKFTISRVVFMLIFALLMSVGVIFLASGAAQDHVERFWIVSGLMGAGYGAIFSLTPLMVTIIWGVENFATNYGIVAMLPALGSTFWGLVYSTIYQASIEHPGSQVPVKDPIISNLCYGLQCYSAAFWAEGICVWMASVLLWAWKGKDCWHKRGILI